LADEPSAAFDCLVDGGGEFFGFADGGGDGGEPRLPGVELEAGFEVDPNKRDV